MRGMAGKLENISEWLCRLFLNPMDVFYVSYNPLLFRDWMKSVFLKVTWFLLFFILLELGHLTWDLPS